MVLHEPQLFTSPAVFTSQPSTYAALQFARPVLHAVTAQFDAEHAVVANGALHARLHWPQCEAFEVRSKSSSMRLSQSLSMPSHCSTPPAVRMQAYSQPLLATPSASHQLAAQEKAQTPLTQLSDALAASQTLPHKPQLLTEFCVFTSQPFCTCRSQSAKPVLHCATLHMPPSQPGVPFGAEHAL